MSKFIFPIVFYIFIFLLNFQTKAFEETGIEEKEGPDQFVVWNVGQGQWTTEIHQKYCLHYDLGGEKDVSYQVLHFCHGKMNFLHISHWDWDHMAYANKYAARVRSACLIDRPAGPSNSRKADLIDQIPLCTPPDLKEVSHWMSNVHSPQTSRKGDSNSLSEVVFSKFFLTLIPGDSPKTQEKIWSENSPTRTEGLVLGHHGSRTSTSLQLLQHLRNLKWAVSTARKKRYGHPHAEVVSLLKKEKVPLLKTEDWGHLHFLKSLR